MSKKGRSRMAPRKGGLGKAQVAATKYKDKQKLLKSNPSAIGKKKKHNFKSKHTRGGEEGEAGAIPHGYTPSRAAPPLPPLTLSSCIRCSPFGDDDCGRWLRGSSANVPFGVYTTVCPNHQTQRRNASCRVTRQRNGGVYMKMTQSYTIYAPHSACFVLTPRTRGGA